jgi:Ca2+-binding EF-hand superfamily protein
MFSFPTEFRECFYLFARSGQIRTLDELTIIMRSLGMSPTIQELKKYLKDKGKFPVVYHVLGIMETKGLSLQP